MASSYFPRSLLARSLLALLILLMIVLAMSMLVNSYNRSLIKQSNNILEVNMPVSINTLEMIDELNDLYLSLYAYANGDANAKGEYFVDSIEYENYRRKLVLPEEVAETGFIEDKSSHRLDSHALSDMLELIDRLYAALQDDVERNIFAPYDPNQDEMRKKRAKFINEEIEGQVLELLKEKEFMDKLGRGYGEAITAAHNMTVALRGDSLETARERAIYFHNIKILQDKSDIVCSRPYTANCVRFLKEVQKLLELGEAYFSNDFIVSQEVILERVHEFNQIYFIPAQEALDNLSTTYNQYINRDIGSLNFRLSQLGRFINFAAIASTIVILIIFTLIWRKTLRPLARVSKILTGLGMQNYDTHIPSPRGSDEVNAIYKDLLSLRNSLVELEEIRNNQMQEAEAKHGTEIEKAYSALKQSEKNLRLYTYKLENMNQDLEQFIHIASHDLREPLKNIAGVVRMLQTELSDVDMDIDPRVEQIQSNLNRMGTLIDDLRALSKLQNLDEEPQKVDLNQIMQEVTKAAKNELDERSVTFKTSKLPSVLGHARYLRIAFDQLLANALQYGARNLEIIVDCEESDEEYIIRFGNNLDEDFQKGQNLLLPFKRGANAKRESSGVGLSICRKIIEDAHEGQISLDEVEPDWFIIYIRLPVPF